MCSRMSLIRSPVIRTPRLSDKPGSGNFMTLNSKILIFFVFGIKIIIGCNMHLLEVTICGQVC